MSEQYVPETGKVCDADSKVLVNLGILKERIEASLARAKGASVYNSIRADIDKNMKPKFILVRDLANAMVKVCDDINQLDQSDEKALDSFIDTVYQPSVEKLHKAMSQVKTEKYEKPSSSKEALSKEINMVKNLKCKVISDDGAKNAGEIFKFTTGDDPKFFVRVNDKEDEFSPSQLCSVKSSTNSTETSEGDKAVTPVDPPAPVAPVKEPTETGLAIGAVGDEPKVPEDLKATGAFAAVGGGKPFRTNRKLNRYSESESASILSSSIGGDLTESFDLTTGSYTYSSSNSKSSARFSGRSSNKTSSHSSRLSESSVKSSSQRSSSHRSSSERN